MLQVEIIRATPDETAKVIRYDVKAEIPGLYTEIVTYCCHLADLTNCDLTNEAMAAARTFALGVLRARLSLWAAQPEQPIGSHPAPSPEPRRRRRTKAEIEAEASSPVTEDSSVSEQAPSPAIQPNADGTMRLDSEEITQGHPPLEASAPSRPPENSPTGAVAEEMERKPEHEAILRQLAAEVYGPHWTARADVKSNVVVFAQHCLANKIRVRYSDGTVHPQVRALFQQMVVSKCAPE
jgi:hypothetical protein